MDKGAKGGPVPAGVRASIARPLQHPVETFTEAERTRLAPHFTNLDRPVFALVNLPETVKGALFARYSRYQGTLRRLFLDEFAESAPQGHVWEGAEGRRAAELYERIFLGYGDDSVAQLGGAHVACEWVSNVLTKVLQRPRLAAYLEQSTRYIPYDAPMPGGGFRYYRDPELGPALRARDGRGLRRYADRAAAGRGVGRERVPRRRLARAPAGDQGQGAGPPARAAARRLAVAHGHLRQRPDLRAAHPAPARPSRCPRRAGTAADPRGRAGRHAELRHARGAPRPRRRVDRLPRGPRARRRALGAPPRASTAKPSPTRAPRCACCTSTATRTRCWSALLFEAAGVGEEATRIRLAALSADERAELLADLVGVRANRRHRPGRGFEALRYRFEIVSDYGAFRDLQRHRMLTVQWQRLTPDLGAGVPEEVRAAGCGDLYSRALDVSRSEWERLAGAGREREAMYALCLGYRIRYVLDLNAREAMQLIELRSGREGHPGYRAVAHEMHRLIAQVHPAVAGAMTHVDTEAEPRLERILSEMRTQAKIDALSGR